MTGAVDCFTSSLKCLSHCASHFVKDNVTNPSIEQRPELKHNPEVDQAGWPGVHGRARSELPVILKASEQSAVCGYGPDGSGSAVKDHGCVSLKQRREANGQLTIASLRALTNILRLLTPWQEVLVAVQVCHHIIHLVWSVAQDPLL